MERTQFKRQLIERATTRGLTEAEVYMQWSESSTIAIYEGEVDRYETSDVGGVSLRARIDGKMGYAYTEKLDESSIDFLIDHVVANAQSLDEEDGTTLFEGSPSYRTPQFYDASLATISKETMIERLLQVEEKLRAYDERIEKVNMCQIVSFSSGKAIQNTLGLDVEEQANGLYLVAGVIVTDGKEKKNGYDVAMIEKWEAFDLDTFVSRVANEALRQLGSTSIPSGHYPVVLRQDAATSLLGVFLTAFSAESVQKGTSRLKGKLNEPIASPHVTIIDNPEDGHLYTRTTFDGEGVATKKWTIVQEGTLQTFLHNRQTAQKDQVETTGHAYKPSYKGTLGIAPHHFALQPSASSVEMLLESIDKGVYITSLAGLHSGANSTSGDFSLAANGYVIENGQITHPMTQMTIAGNFFDCLKQIQAVANDPYEQGTTVSSPTIRIDRLAVTVEQ